MLNKNIKIAIVHDYLNQMGGAERVVAVFHEMFPKAPIFTTIVDYNKLLPELKSADIRPTWMQKLPAIKKNFKKYFLLYPKAIESLDLDDYDIIISSSSAFAKGARKGRGALHICYCYTPMRFAWDYERYVEKELFNPFVKSILSFFIRFVIRFVKKWDIETKDRPDYYIAISTVVKDRIRKYYGRDSEIIYPPVDVDKFKPADYNEGFYLIVSRLNAYKRVDLAIEAFNRLNIPLKIAGEGPFKGKLKSMAGPNIEFLGRISDEKLTELYSRCKALIFPGEEDFGLTPLEANAAGRPVIAYKAGGAIDTIIEGINGVFFKELNAISIMDAVICIESGKYPFDPLNIREHALKFRKSIFTGKIMDFITKKQQKHLIEREQ